MKKIVAAFFFSTLAFSAQRDCDLGVGLGYDLTSGTCDNFGTLLDARSDLFINGMAGASPSANITQLRKRQLTPPGDSDQTCNSVGGNIVCLNQRSGDFVDRDGTRGNLKTGHYTTKSGQQGNIYCDRRAQPIPSNAYDLVGATSVLPATKATLLSSYPSLLTQSTGASSLNKAATSAESTGNKASSSSSSKTTATATASCAASEMPIDTLFNIIFAVLLTTGTIAGSFLWETFRL